MFAFLDSFRVVCRVKINVSIVVMHLYSTLCVYLLNVQDKNTEKAIKRKESRTGETKVI